MSNSFKAILGLILMAVAASAQQPAQPSAAYPVSNSPWVVSVVHIVDSQKIIERLRKDKNRVGLLAAAPQNVYNIATGLVIDERGHIVTRLANLDPEDKDQRISITTSDGKNLAARLIGIDCATGFAVLEADLLKISLPASDSNDLTNDMTVNMLTTDVRARVVNTGGTEKTYLYPAITQAVGHVKTEKLISRLNNSITLLSENLLSRSDSSVITAVDGKVIGMAQYVGYGRANVYPVEFIRDTVAKRVIEKQSSVPAGWLGVVGKSLTELSESELAALGLARMPGVVVKEITPDSPASRSGVHLNDVIVGVDDTAVTGTFDLKVLMISSPAGRVVKLRAIRELQPIEIPVELGALPVNIEVISTIGATQRGAPTSEPEQLIARWNALTPQFRALMEQRKKFPNAAGAKERDEKLQELEIEIRQILDRFTALGIQDVPPVPAAPRTGPGVFPALTENPDTNFPLGFMGRNLTGQLPGLYKVSGGVWVISVAGDSAAARAGLKVGDVIIGTDQQEGISTISLLKMLSPQPETLTLKVVRKGELEPVAITIKK